VSAPNVITTIAVDGFRLTVKTKNGGGHTLGLCIFIYVIRLLCVVCETGEKKWHG